MEWISVKDRLPDDGEYKIVAYNDGTVFVDFYHVDGWANDGVPTVEYWMALPDPPKWI